MSAIDIAVRDGVTGEEAREALRVSVERERQIASARLAAYQARASAFERKHGMTTAEFRVRFDSGDMGDDAEWFDWYAVARAIETWSHRTKILHGIAP
jgi:hypothetical protein